MGGRLEVAVPRSKGATSADQDRMRSSAWDGDDGTPHIDAIPARPYRWIAKVPCYPNLVVR